MPRWCPRCGRPKELHKQVEVPTEAGTEKIRVCRLEELGVDEHEIEHYRADRDAYRKAELKRSKAS